jgi:hypothetical protein
VRKRHFLSTSYITTIILPRQARDKHRKRPKKSAVFSVRDFQAAFKRPTVFVITMKTGAREHLHVVYIFDNIAHYCQACMRVCEQASMVTERCVHLPWLCLVVLSFCCALAGGELTDGRMCRQLWDHAHCSE